MGAFVKARREQLGLSQGDIIKALGYKSRNAVSNIETGIEGLPARRIYAWADLLEVSREALFLFATGEAATMTAAARKGRGEAALTSSERKLLESYRALPPRYQRRIREQAADYRRLTGRRG